MSRVYVVVKVNMIMDLDCDDDLNHVMNEMNYTFSDSTGKASIVETYVDDYEHQFEGEE